jgi:hypothetical protein
MAGKVTRALGERFWEKVTKTNGCWLWIANSNKKGYGRFWINGRNEFSHRVSWMLHFVEIPHGMLVLHKCDNPSCVNPAHLFLGTDADNQSDKKEKGRSAKGERNGNRKLTNEQVRVIRKSVGSPQELATQFNIDKTQIYNIISRKQWKHVE